MAINSRNKGVRGELEAAAFLRKHGFTAERGQQHAGGADSQDVKHDMDGFHVEVKRTEKGNPYDWIEQAQRDKGKDTDALVLHRRNHKPWLVIMDADAFMNMVNKYVFEKGVAS